MKTAQNFAEWTDQNRAESEIANTQAENERLRRECARLESKRIALLNALKELYGADRGGWPNGYQMEAAAAVIAENE